MTDPFIGEVQIFAFPFAPAGWALCNGAMMQLRQASTLFALIGTTYGGDGTSTFQLPNLVNRLPNSQGTGPGLSQRTIGETYGENQISLAQNQIPSHNHSTTLYRQALSTARIGTPTNGAGLSEPAKATSLVPSASKSADTTFALNMIGTTGTNLPHENRQPCLALNFCIALAGPFPAFN